MKKGAALKKKEAVVQPAASNAVVWQWLTYVAWLLTLGAFTVVLMPTLMYFVNKNANASDYSDIAYAMTALVCLAGTTFFVDRQYRKVEPKHKTGFAAVVMSIHAVIAFVVSLGTAVGAITTLVRVLTDINTDTKELWAVIIGLVIVSKLAALMFLRITGLDAPWKVMRFFRPIVAAVLLVALLAAGFGPLKASIANRQDRFIESQLPSLSNTISAYISTNKDFPKKLQDLKFDDYQKNSKALIDKGMVEFSQKGVSDQNTITASAQATEKLAIYPAPEQSSKVYKYELCVNYKKSKGTGQKPNNAYDMGSYIDTSSHPSGKVCYDQSVYVYENDPKMGPAVPMPAKGMDDVMKTESSSNIAL